MTIKSTGTNDERLARHFLLAQQTFEGVTQLSCLEMLEGLNEEQCELMEAASKVVVDEPLRTRLVSAGLAKRFIDMFAGDDGMLALKMRAGFFLSIPNPNDEIFAKLGSLGPGAEIAIPMLIAKAREKNISAIQTLGKIGPKAKSTIPMLMELAKDAIIRSPHPDESNQNFPSPLAKAAIESLGLICQPPAGPSDDKLFSEVRDLITKIYNGYKTGQGLLSALLSVEDKKSLPDRIKAIEEMNISIPDERQKTLSKILPSANDASKISIINIFRLHLSNASASTIGAIGMCLSSDNAGISRAAYEALSSFADKTPDLVFNSLLGIANIFSLNARTLFARICREKAAVAKATINYWRRLTTNNSNPAAQQEAAEVLREIEKNRHEQLNW